MTIELAATARSVRHVPFILVRAHITISPYRGFVVVLWGPTSRVIRALCLHWRISAWTDRNISTHSRTIFSRHSRHSRHN